MENQSAGRNVNVGVHLFFVAFGALVLVLLLAKLEPSIAPIQIGME